MKETIKIFELFAGIGANSKALTNLGIDHEIVGYSEIDTYASKSFAAVHGISEELNFGDITKIEKLPCEIDLLTGGFPCQAFSNAGNGLGVEDPRGLLAMDMVRVAKFNRPKVIVAENVKGLLSSKHKPLLDLYISELSNLGYETVYKTLNSKDFGVPQDRKRVIIVSQLAGSFNFENLIKKEQVSLDTILSKTDQFKPMQPKMMKTLQDMDAVDFEHGNGYFIANSPQTREYRGFSKISPTLFARDFKGPKVVAHKSGEVITYRRLEPQECWKLMGFCEEDFDKSKKSGISDSQLYKQAGNSIVVPVLEAIFTELLNPKINEINGHAFKQESLL